MSKPLSPDTRAVLAARPLLEQVARLGDCIGANTVDDIIAISSRAAAWLEENPPGQQAAPAPAAPVPTGDDLALKTFRFQWLTPPPNTLCHTVYADRTIGLIITAWPSPVLFPGGWLVRFRRNAPRLNQVADWHPVSGWDRHLWPPGSARLVPPAALTAVEAWLVARAALGVAS